MVHFLRALAVGLAVLLAAVLPVDALAQDFNGSDLRVGVQAGEDNGVTTGMVDDSEMLTYNEEYVIQNLTTNINFPDSVTHVTYMLFRTNNSDLLIDVHNADTEHNLGLFEFDASGESSQTLNFAPGNLIIAVGLNPEAEGIYAPPQVRDDLGLNNNSHLRGAREAMESYLKTDEWDGALLAGARAAADPTVETTRRPVWVIVLGIWVVIALIVGVIYLFVRLRHSDAISIKQDMRWLEKNYPLAVANFGQANLQFNSLDSPLKNQHIIPQWEEISQKMRDLAGELDRLQPLPKDASEEDVARRAEVVSVMRNTLEGYNTAAANIEHLYGFETGDLSRRKNTLTWLIGDLARAEREDPSATYEELIADAQQLSPDAEDFVDRYVELIRTYGQLRARPNSQVTAPLHTPALWDADWHPGMIAVYRSVWQQTV